MTVCPECGKEFAQPKIGRPRKYCSNTCSATVRKRKQRARLEAERADTAYLDDISATETERKVFAVWNDPKLRARWMGALTTYQKLLGKLGRRFELLHDLPVDMNGSTAHVVLDDEGEIAYRFTDTLTGTVQKAVAELVHDHEPDRITDAMVTNRVNARLLDELRRSDEYERVEAEVVPIPEQPVIVTGANGSRRTWRPKREPKVKRITRRKQLLNRRYDRKDVAGDRASAAEDRRRRVEAMPPLLRYVYQLCKTVEMAPVDVAGIVSEPGKTVTAHQVKEALQGDPLKVLERTFTGRAHIPRPMLQLLMVQAYYLAGDELPEELLDDGGEDVADDEGEKTVENIMGTGLE